MNLTPRQIDTYLLNLVKINRAKAGEVEEKWNYPVTGIPVRIKGGQTNKWLKLRK